MITFSHLKSGITLSILSIFIWLFSGLLSTANAQTIGNAWHYPWDSQSNGNIPSMRQPVFMLYTNTPLVLVTGNQSGGGGGNPGNQLATGSAVFYRTNGKGNWIEHPLTFHSQSGNNKYYHATLPPNIGHPGELVEYYFRILYSDHDTTYIYNNGTSRSVTSDNEHVAKNDPFEINILSTPAPAFASPEDWRDLNIYQILTDRFYDGDPSNNHANPHATFNPNIRSAIHGGDFKGVVKKLDYLKSLGVDALWISPIQQNRGIDSYHGYGADDWYKLAPHWGSVEDLRNMVDACHARGIYVILDIVANHMSRRIGSDDSGWPSFRSPPNGYNMRWESSGTYPPPFDRLDYFNNNGAIVNFHGDEEIYGELAGLDDLKTESQYVRDNLSRAFEYWIHVADFDGFRIDTVRHVEIGFWQQFNPDMRNFATSIGKSNFFQFGEAFTSDEGGVGYFTGTQAGGAFANDAVLDYPLYFAMDDVFARGTGNTKKIEDHYNALPTWYDPASHNVLPTFIDNHDNDRFLSVNKANNNWDKLRVALSFLYSSRGIPTLYYGTEQAFSGELGNDNANRPDMFDGGFEFGPSQGDNFNMTHPLFIHIAFLNNLRRNYPSLRRGEHIGRWNDPSGPGLFAYVRRLGDEEIFVVVNSHQNSQWLPPRQTHYPQGTVMVNLYDPNETFTVRAGAEGTPWLEVSGFGAKMFIPQNRFIPLDPVIVQQSPSHDSHQISVTAPLSFTFSQAMIPETVEATFSTHPPTPGSFTWSNGNKTLTFTPDPPGFPGSTNLVIRFQSTAKSAENQRALYADFENLLHTQTANLSDSDMDGLPDWWMQLYYQHPTGQVSDLSRPQDDSDQDGASNEEEFIAGTNPTLNESRFWIAPTFTQDETELRFPSLVNRMYHLETTTNLTFPTAWSCIQSNVPGIYGDLTLSAPYSTDAMYYRVQVEFR